MLIRFSRQEKYHCRLQICAEFEAKFYIYAIFQHYKPQIKLKIKNRRKPKQNRNARLRQSSKKTNKVGKDTQILVCWMRHMRRRKEKETDRWKFSVSRSADTELPMEWHVHKRPNFVIKKERADWVWKLRGV
jgi:hypothetical protein